MITGNQIVESLTAVGLKRGDPLLVHSSLRNIGPIDGGADALIDALLAVVGPEGTLAMPTFNYTRPPPTPYFDLRETPGKTGILTEIFRKRPETIRSEHPSHSVAAQGKRAAEFLADHRKSAVFGIGSPIDRLAQAGGWVLLLGVTQVSNSTIHVGESHAGVRKFWWDEGDPPRVKMKLGDSSIVEHQFDPSSSCSTSFNAVEHPMRVRGLIRDLRVGDAISFLMRGRDIISTVVEMIRERPGILFCNRIGCRPCAKAREHLQSR